MVSLYKSGVFVVKKKEMWYSVIYKEFKNRGGVVMGDEFTLNEEMEYIEYEGNRFLIVRGVLKDVQVETAVVRLPEEVKDRLF